MMVSLFAFLRNGRETEGVFAVCFRFAPRGTSAAAHCRVVEAPSSLPAACGLPGQAGTSTSFSGRGRSGPSSGSAEGKPRVLRSAPPVPFPVRCPSAGLPEKKLLRVRSLGRAHAAAALLFGTCAPHSVRWAGMSPGSTHPPLGSRAAAQESSVPNTLFSSFLTLLVSSLANWKLCFLMLALPSLLHPRGEATLYPEIERGDGTGWCRWCCHSPWSRAGAARGPAASRRRVKLFPRALPTGGAGAAPAEEARPSRSTKLLSLSISRKMCNGSLTKARASGQVGCCCLCCLQSWIAPASLLSSCSLHLSSLEVDSLPRSETLLFRRFAAREFKLSSFLSGPKGSFSTSPWGVRGDSSIYWCILWELMSVCGMQVLFPSC